MNRGGDRREPTPAAGPPSIRRECAFLTAAALILTLTLFSRWLAESSVAIPDPAAIGNLGGGADARLNVWTLAWDAHALLHQPLRFFDANIFHPAPSMLAGSETLLASALLGAPLNAWTGNPVLTANLLAIATYPLAFVLTYALLRRLRYRPVACLVAAVAVTLGPFRVPADLRTLNYPNYVLPAVLLAGLASTRGRIGWLVATSAFAFLTSYYVAAMAILVLGIETSLVLVSAGARRAARFASGWLTGIGLLALLSIPYLRHGRDVPLPGAGAPSWEQVGIAFQRTYVDPGDPLVGVGWAIASLALLGFAVPLLDRTRPDLRWWRWVLITTLSLALAAGPLLQLGSLQIPLPYAFVLDTPLAALRAFSRFFIATQFGLACLAAVGADFLIGLRPLATRRVLRWLVAASLLAWVALPRGQRLTDLPMTRLEAGAAPTAVYRELATATDGPVLEIPGPWRSAGLGRAVIQGDFMVASTHHWRPLLNGHTGYPPWWHSTLISEVERLPDAHALRALVNLTGLKWIVLHLERAEGQVVASWRRALSESPDWLRGREVDGHLLIEVTRGAERSWAAGLAGGPRAPGTTPLGTSREPLAPDAARAALAWGRPPPRAAVPAGTPLRFGVRVANESASDWPALRHPRDPESSGLVVLEVTWRDSQGRPVGRVENVPLGRDLLPGDAVEVPVSVVSPSSAGDHELLVRVRQVGSDSFAGSPPLRRWVDVRDDPPGGDGSRDREERGRSRRSARRPRAPTPGSRT